MALNDGLTKRSNNSLVYVMVGETFYHFFFLNCNKTSKKKLNALETSFIKGARCLFHILDWGGYIEKITRVSLSLLLLVPR